MRVPVELCATRMQWDTDNARQRFAARRKRRKVKWECSFKEAGGCVGTSLKRLDSIDVSSEMKLSSQICRFAEEDKDARALSPELKGAGALSCLLL
jgi:hypothetical protein